MNILIVDDSKDYRESMRNYFELMLPDATISEAADGLQAIKLIPDVNPDIIFLDFNMPGMSGFSVAEYTLANHPGVKIVMSTMQYIPDFNRDRCSWLFVQRMRPLRNNSMLREGSCGGKIFRKGSSKTF